MKEVQRFAVRAGYGWLVRQKVQEAVDAAARLDDSMPPRWLSDHGAVTVVVVLEEEAMPEAPRAAD